MKRKIKTKKRTKRIRKRQKGGTNSFIICESEGCVMYPSIISMEEDRYRRITKIYSHSKYFQAEQEKYTLFDRYDPECHLHPQTFGVGQLSTEQIPEELTKKIKTNPSLLLTDSPYYLDMEYVGEPITNHVEHLDTILQYINFIISFLSLIDREKGTTLVHPDMHGRNICIQGDQIKTIDLTGLEEIDFNQPHQTTQWMNICGTLIAMNFLCSEVRNKEPILSAKQSIEAIVEDKENSWEITCARVIQVLEELLRADFLTPPPPSPPSKKKRR